MIGATGNIGPHLIRQLAELGAGTVVAVSRNPGFEARRAGCRPGTRRHFSGDGRRRRGRRIGDERGLRPLRRRLPPLAGIYVAAFAGGPITLLDMTTDDVTAMFRPKLDVVSLLHRLSVRHSIDQFVLFSSISGLTGSRWLAHYTATTTFLDTFALARRAAGLPATAINWGLWKSLSERPIRRGEAGHDRLRSAADGRRRRHQGAALAHRPWRAGPRRRSSPPTGPCSRPHTAPERPCTSSTTC